MDTSQGPRWKKEPKRQGPKARLRSNKHPGDDDRSAELKKKVKRMGEGVEVSLSLLRVEAGERKVQASKADQWNAGQSSARSPRLVLLRHLLSTCQGASASKVLLAEAWLSGPRREVCGTHWEPPPLGRMEYTYQYPCY